MVKIALIWIKVIVLHSMGIYAIIKLYLLRQAHIAGQMIMLDVRAQIYRFAQFLMEKIALPKMEHFV